MKGTLTHLRYLKEIVGHPLNRDARMRAAARYFFWNLGRRLVPDAEYLIGLTDGSSLAISNEENYATLVYTERLWDFEEMSFLLHFLRRDDLFVDVGANVGGYVVLASAVAKAFSIAIEAVPSTFTKLRLNTRLNEIEDLVELHNTAAGESPGELRFTHALGGLNHVALPHEVDVISVPVVTLDSIVRERPVRMMKLDVEGFETEVLRGSEETISNKSLAAIIVE